MIKKMLLSLFFLIGGLCLGYYTSTYLPQQAAPSRPDYPGYDEFTLGQQYFLEGYELKGIRYLDESASKGYIPAYRKLGEIYYYKRNKPEMAKEYYQKAVDAGDIIALETLAAVYESENNFAKAVEMYEKLAKKNPPLLLKVHDLYLKLGDQKKAAEALKQYQEFNEYYYWHR